MPIIPPHNEMIRVGAMREYRASGNRATARIRFCDRWRHAVSSVKKQQTRTETNRRGKSMKKLLLIALAVSGLVFVPAQRSDAQITVGLPGVGGISVGFPGGYYAYPTYYNYYPYGYYRRPYYSYSQPSSYYYGRPSYYSYNGRRTYHRHHRHHYHNRY